MARKRAAKTVTCPTCGADVEAGGGALNFCPTCGADLRAAVAAAAGSVGFVDRVIADRYRLLALLGEGGMGAVYKAEHIRMGKALALKILRGDFARSPGAAQRFLSEARIVSRLSHPHTIAVFDFGEPALAGSGFYLAMEYVPGKDLATLLREGGPLPEPRVAEIGQQLLGSLAEAHDAGIVHRDVKPGNVMLMETRSGEDYVKVLDFGIAKLRDAGPDAEQDAQLPRTPVVSAGATAITTGGDTTGGTTTTGAGTIVGTPSYLAPEQARGEPADVRSDLYAVGCVLYELVAGRPPFQAPTPMAVVAAHLHQEPRPLAELAPVSRRFAEVVHRALRKRPEERWASADAMLEALGDASEPTGAHRLEKGSAPEITGELRIASRQDFAEFERHVRSLRRGRVLAPTLAFLAAAVVALAAWRWADVYAVLAARAPRVAAALPAALRPSALYDGEEHEPNDVPSQANPLPLPRGPDGRPAGGLATIRGHIGAKLSETSGDVDIYRLEVPPSDGRRVLVAEWRGERAGEGIRGLDVALALNRERAAGDARTSAPLVASVNRGGPGKPERLVAAVDAGVYYLSVREVHDPATGPVEKPTDRYVLDVRLTDPEAGQELEPNDGPDRSGSRYERYVEWRATAERNRLGEASPVHGETGPDDPDVYAVEPAAPGEAPELVAIVPEASLAVVARAWRPDADDLAPRLQDRVRFGEPVSGAPGQPLALRLGGPTPAGRPDLVLLRGAAGQGRYDVVALGRGAASGAAVTALVRALVAAGRAGAAQELAAACAAALPGAPGLEEALRLAAPDPAGAATADAAAPAAASPPR
jgi:serine/threonine-protein kinase